MMPLDLFGTGARARVKALEEALAIERARTADLTRQLIAMSDTKAFKVLHPDAVKPPRITVDKNVMRSPSDVPDSTAYLRNLRDAPQKPKVM